MPSTSKVIGAGRGEGGAGEAHLKKYSCKAKSYEKKLSMPSSPKEYS